MLSALETVFFSFIEFFCGLVCALTIFRLPIRYRLLHISVMALIISIVTTLTFINLPNAALIINFSCLTILLTIIYRLPFFYSLLVAFLLYLLGFIFEYGVFSFVGFVLQVSPEVDSYVANLAYLFTGVVYLIISWLLERKKLGFMFISRYFTLRHNVKGYNLALSIMLIAGIVTVQLASILTLNKHFAYSNFILIFLMTILFLLTIFIAYRQNKRQLREKHERLEKR